MIFEIRDSNFDSDNNNNNSIYLDTMKLSVTNWCGRVPNYNTTVYITSSTYFLIYISLTIFYFFIVFIYIIRIVCK